MEVTSDGILRLRYTGNRHDPVLSMSLFGRRYETRKSFGLISYSIFEKVWGWFPPTRPVLPRRGKLRAVELKAPSWLSNWSTLENFNATAWVIETRQKISPPVQTCVVRTANATRQLTPTLCKTINDQQNTSECRKDPFCEMHIYTFKTFIIDVDITLD